MLFNNTFRNINRTREILGILIKYGFEDFIANSTLKNLVTESMRIRWLRDEKPVNFVNPQVWEKHLQRIKGFPVYKN